MGNPQAGWRPGMLKDKVKMARKTVALSSGFEEVPTSIKKN
jgi:hypothetical protein